MVIRKIVREIIDCLAIIKHDCRENISTHRISKRDHNENVTGIFLKHEIMKKMLSNNRH